MSIWNPDQYLDSDEQAALQQYQQEQNARLQHDRLLELIERKNTFDAEKQRQIAQENQEKLRARREYSLQEQQSLYEESEKRINDIINNNIYYNNK